MRYGIALTLCALLLTFARAQAADAGTSHRVPQGFAGVVIDGPLWPHAVDATFTRQLDLMVASGVESIRAQFDWAQVQPYAGWAQVPASERSRFTDVDGLPLDLGELDALVAACARRGLALEPLVADAPGWDAIPARPGTLRLLATPAHDGPYGRFLAALIHRYGPAGTLWRTPGLPRRPIRSWQVWNEPNLPIFWAHQPDYASSYVALLRVAHAAVKAADPHASVVLAGLTNASWTVMAAILRVRGARGLFDVAAVHPYTRFPAGVLTILRRFRFALDHGGARGRPILVDEFGWTSSQGKSSQHFGPETTERGQANNLGQALGELAGARASLRLVGIDYYDWAGSELIYEFNFAGLLRDVNGVFGAKPALSVYRRDVLKLEACRQKSRDARRCARP